MPVLTILCALLFGCLILAAVLLIKRRDWRTLGVVGVLTFGALFAMFRPVCAPIPETELRHFAPPIEERDGTNFYGLKTFQRRGEQWFYCNTAVASWFTF